MDTIKSRAEFEKVFFSGRKASCPLLRITVLHDEGAPGRVAFVAARKLGTAVFRNRSKRVLREAARTVGLPREGWQTILFATPKTATAAPEELAEALRGLLSRVEGGSRGQAAT